MRRALVVLVSILALVIGVAWAQEKAPEVKKEAAPKFQYVGVDGCKTCHKSAKSGEQYAKWQAGPHAGAYATLATEESVALGKKLELKTAPQEAPECLGCHSTAYGLKPEEMAKPMKLEDGVQCESCHGPGSEYKKMNIMKDHQKAVEAGLWVISEEGCVKCHNKKSPTYKEFDFAKKSKMIAHPTPKAEKAEEKAE